MIKSSETKTNSIAKNTLFLYFRMILIMLISLITARFVLQILGFEDFGIYNLIGGIVSIFSLLSNVMSVASQRYFSIEIGRSIKNKLREYFSITIIGYGILCIIILILSEGIGVWFINNKLQISQERLYAANFIYQISIISFIIQMMLSPYHAIIISKEKFDVYAYVGIIEVILKLLIVYILYYSNFDKLIVYSMLLLFVNLIVLSIYIIYCYFKIKETRLVWYWDKNIIKDMTSYCGWSFFGSFAGICKSQGLNILLNVFFGALINSARAISFQIYFMINQFVMNFFKAVQPQITKRYAKNDIIGLTSLICTSSKMSFFLLYFISFPILINIEYLLKLWLGEYPDMTIIFSKLIIIQALIESLSHPIMTAIQASGRIKKYQISISLILLMILPVSYLLFRLDFMNAELTYIVTIVFTLIAQIFRMYFMKKIINISIYNYSKTIFPYIIAVIVASLIPYYLFKKIEYTSLISLIINMGLIMMINSLIIIVLGTNKKAI